MAQDEQQPAWLRNLREQQPSEQPFLAQDQQLFDGLCVVKEIAA